jgi:ATP synthase F1 delta subunit
VTPKEYAAANNYAKILLRIYCPSCKDTGQEGDSVLHHATLKALRQVNNLLKNKRDYHFLLSLSRLPQEKSNLILEKIADALVFDKSFLFFLKFVVHNKRIQLFPSIVAVATKMIREKLEMEECKIFASHQLSKEKLEVLQKSFSHKLGKKLDINFTIKKDLVLGLRVITEKYIWESSFAQKLQQLTLCLNFGIGHEK